MTRSLEDDGGQQQWSHGVGGQAFELDILANQTSVKTDLSGDGDFDDTGSSGDRVETREHNEINQITDRALEEDPVHGYQPSLPFVYDDAGNMRESTLDGGSSTRIYTHDAWNRLVRVEVEVSSQTYALAEYEYNGLSWRTIKRADTDTVPDDELDEVRVMYYDAQWRIIEEEVDDDAVDPYDEEPDRRLQYVWGIRALDDIIMHRIDRDLDNAYNTQLYHLTDIQFTTNAIVDEQGRVVERVQYDAFGEARHHYNGDMDADGDVDGNDQSIASAAGGKNIWQAGYLVEADANRDGQITAGDQSYVTGLYQTIGGMPVVALAPGEISDPYLVDNQVGWSGYIFNREVDLYTIRHRHYSPAFGRWIEQDPAGYIDSANLYGYGYGSPIGVMDPSGLGIGEWVDAKLESLLGDYYTIAKEFARGVGSSIYDLLKALGGSILHPIETIKNAWNGAKQLMNMILDGDLYEAFAALFPDLARLIKDWHCLSDAEKAYLIGRIVGELGADILGGAMAAKLAAKLLKPARRARLGTVAEKLAEMLNKGDGPGDLTPDGICFIGSTLVATAAGFVPISDLDVGDRVLTTPSESTAVVMSADEPSVIDESQWRLMRIEMPNPDGTPDLIVIQALRPVGWIADHGFAQGRIVEFALDEMRLRGQAFVRSIDPCPPIDEGLGEVILSTVTHFNGHVLDIEFSDANQSLSPTRRHRFYSLDRNDWIAAEDLLVGERLRSDDEDGQTQIESITPRVGIYRVYNLEVQTDHCYLVGNGRILTHNNNPCAMPTPDTPPRGINNNATREAVTTGNQVHGRVTRVARMKGWKANSQIAKGSRLRPDVITPKGRVVEIKPGTRSGVRAGRKQIHRYRTITGKNGRVLYYDPVNPWGPLSFTPYFQ